MEKLTFRCIECGQSKEILESLDNIDKEDCLCPMCGSEMDLQDTTNAITISDIVKKDGITQMKKNINALGNNKVWAIIEDLINVKTRLAYRKIFFNSGGIMPDNKKEELR